MTGNRKNADDQAGVQETRQDNKQDDVARQRQGQQDQKLRDAHSKKPVRKDGGNDPA